MRRLALLGIVFCLSSVALDALAQSGQGGVANSGMSQGEAVVAVRSDVRLSIKGIRATLTDRLAAMTQEISAQMPAVRQCYTKLVATRPASVGGLRATIILEPGGGAPNLTITEVDGSDQELTACVTKTLRKLTFARVERPAAVEMELAFDNSRARGQVALEERRDEFQVVVEAGPDASRVARWQTDGGEVMFVVSVAANEGDEVVRALVTAIRGGFSAFLDCRRRAGRQGMNPVGTIGVRVRIARDGSLSGQVTRAEIQDQKRTPTCVEKGLERANVGRQTAAHDAQIDVTFAADRPATP